MEYVINTNGWVLFVRYLPSVIGTRNGTKPPCSHCCWNPRLVSDIVMSGKDIWEPTLVKGVSLHEEVCVIWKSVPFLEMYYRCFTLLVTGTTINTEYSLPGETNIREFINDLIISWTLWCRLGGPLEIVPKNQNYIMYFIY